MSLVLVAIVAHVGAGGIWLVATLLVSVTGQGRRVWLRLFLLLALLNMLAGIYLWHVLHAGPWGTVEHLLVVGTFCAFLALGLQAPVALAQASDQRRLVEPSLAITRASAVFVVAAAAAMIASRFAT